MQKVIVAGATGYLGRFVVQESKKRGYWVRALARNPQKFEKTGPSWSLCQNPASRRPGRIVFLDVKQQNTSCQSGWQLS
jgi:nucleoside-diphosphate-sugar epimerase